MNAKKRGCAYQFGDMGLAEIGSKTIGHFVLPFSPFFFSAQGCTHTHHRPRIAQFDSDKVSERIQGDRPRVLEVPPAQVFHSPLPFISVPAAVCPLSAAMCIVGPRTPATNTYRNSAFDDTSSQSVCILKSSIPDIDLVLQGRTAKAGQELSKRDVSHLRLIAHVDCPLFDPLTLDALFCMSAAILLYSPNPRRSDVRCITPLFEKHQLMLYEI